MQRNHIYIFIMTITILAITALVLVSSLIIKRPALLGGAATLTAVVLIQNEPRPSLTDEWTLPVFTATPADNNPAQTAVSLPSPAVTQTGSMPDEPDLVTETAPAATAPGKDRESFCGRSGAITLVGLALSEANDQEQRSVIMIRYLHVDFEDQRIAILSVPPSLVLSGKTVTSLNLVNPTIDELYNYTINHLSQPGLVPETVGANVIARSIYEQTGVVPEQSFILTAEDIISILDLFGEIHAPPASEMDSAARVIQNGQQAWDLIRGDQGETTDILKVQDTVLKAILDRLVDPAVIEKTPLIINQFHTDAVSDIEKSTLLQLACALENVSLQDIQFFQLLPPLTLQPGETDYISDPVAVRSLLQEYFGK